MNVFRAVGLLIGVMLIGLAVVDLRRLTAQNAYQLHKLYRQRTELQRQVWQGRLRLTSLQSPKQIRQRVGRLGLQMIYPGEHSPDQVPSGR